MEMPEGWKSIKERVNDITSEFSFYTKDEYELARDVEDKALPLLKEMAETVKTLQHLYRDELGEKLRRNKDLMKDENFRARYGVMVDAYTTLKKFKEWK